MPSKPATKPSATTKPRATKARTAKPLTSIRAVPKASAGVLRKLDQIASKRESSAKDTPRARGVIEMPGRLLADGSRRGAKTARRVTFYLPPELATEISVRAAREGITLSEVASEILAAAFDMPLRSASDGG